MFSSTKKSVNWEVEVVISLSGVSKWLNHNHDTEESNQILTTMEQEVYTWSHSTVPIETDVTSHNHEGLRARFAVFFNFWK